MSNNTLPLLTICIPTYERAELLDNCLEVLHDIQVHSHGFCLIVGDNGSKDNTQEILAKWKPKFRFMETISHETNIGYDRNVFSLYMSVKTEYCWLLGDGDSISLEHFSKIEEDISKGYDAVVINTLPSKMLLDSKIYSDFDNFLDEQLWHITKLSSFVLTHKALVPVLMQRYFDSRFIHVGTFVEYLNQAGKFAIFYDKDVELVYLGDEAKKAEQKGEWRQIPFQVWGRCFSSLVFSFPISVSYEQKLKLIKDHERHFHWFGVRALIMNKTYRGRIFVDDYKHNRQYVHLVTVASTILSDMVMYLPIEPFYKMFRFVKSLLKA